MDNNEIFSCKHCKTTFKRKCNLEKHVKLNHNSETVDSVINSLVNRKINVENNAYITDNNQTCLSNRLKQTRNHINDRECDISSEHEYDHNLDAFDSFTDEYYSSDNQTIIKVDDNRRNYDSIKSKTLKTSLNIKSKRCKKKLTKQRDNDSHKRLSIFVCKACNTEFNRLCDLEKHVNHKHGFSKTVMRPFKCNQCTSDFIEAVYLRKHIYSVHGEKKFVCEWENCEYKTADHHKLILHKQRHENIRLNLCCWPGCDERFPTKKDLVAHIKKTHGTDSYNQYPIEGFKCSMCEQILFTRESLNLHIMAKHTNDRPFACDKCDKSFVSEQSLKKHIKYVHEEKKFKCNDCKFRAFDRRDLDVHVRRVHLREKTIRCEFPECNGKLFFALKSLKAHNRNKHSDIRPFVCDWPECDATYKYKHELKKHINRHFGK